MKRAFSTLCCLEYSFDEVLILASDTGMDGVELRIDDRRLEATTDAAEAGRHFKEKGIRICDVASSIFLNGGNLPDTAVRYVDLAAQLGAGAVRVFAGGKNADGECDVRGIAEALAKLCDYGAERGVEVWLETHSEVSTGKVCRSIVDMANKDNLKILWDVLHSIEYGETMKETVDHIGDVISHVHLKDGVPSAEKIEYILTDLGDGDFPFGEVKKVLDGIGFDGYYSLEWESPWCPEIRHLYSDPHDLLKKYNEILDELE